MSDETGIAWTDSTFNPWWGCTRVSPGCDNCYAATFDKRVGGDYWNPKIAPRHMSEQNWNKPLKWNREAEATGNRRKVFCGSMCDWADNKAPEGARDRLWDLIRRTPWLDWQLLSKRETLIERSLPPDWGNGWKHVWLGATVEDRAFGLPRINRLRRIRACTRFLSIEPLIENLGPLDLTGIHWVIVGGESGPGFRAMNPAWADAVVEQCLETGVPVFFKQWGGLGRDHGGDIWNGMKLHQFPIRAA